MNRPSKRRWAKYRRRSGVIGLLCWFVLLCVGGGQLLDYWLIVLGLLFVFPLILIGAVELAYRVRRMLWLRETRR